MKKISSILFIALFGFFIAGCTTLRPPLSVTQNSAIEQGLTFEAEKACCEVIFVTHDNRTIEQIDKEISQLNTKIDDERVFAYAHHKHLIDALAKLQTERKTVEEKMKIPSLLGNVISGNVYYIEVLGIPARVFAYKYILENLLKEKNATIINQEDKADCKIQIFVKQDGIDNDTYNFLHLYMDETIAAKVKMNASITNCKTKASIILDDLTASKSHVRSYIFGFGPIVTSDIEGY